MIPKSSNIVKWLVIWGLFFLVRYIECAFIFVCDCWVCSSMTELSSWSHHSVSIPRGPNHIHFKNWNSSVMLLLTPPASVPLLVLIITANRHTTRRNNAAITELKISWNSQGKHSIFSEIHDWRRTWIAPNIVWIIKNCWFTMKIELH